MDILLTVLTSEKWTTNVHCILIVGKIFSVCVCIYLYICDNKSFIQEQSWPIIRMTLCSEKEYRDKLLRIVKKEVCEHSIKLYQSWWPLWISISSTTHSFIQVKQIMEEAVTRKFVHEESSSITSLCGKLFFLPLEIFNCLLILTILVKLEINQSKTPSHLHCSISITSFNRHVFETFSLSLDSTHM